MEIDQNTNLIFQSFYSTRLLIDLQCNKFLESNFYNEMQFKYPAIKEELKKICIDNQGTMLMTLYALLVVPKALLFSQFSTEFDKVNRELCQIVLKDETTSTYKNEESLDSIDYIRHIRNAVSHASVVFFERDKVKFHDEYEYFDKKNKTKTKSTCDITIPLICVHNLIESLESILKKYLESLHK